MIAVCFKYHLTKENLKFLTGGKCCGFAIGVFQVLPGGERMALRTEWKLTPHSRNRSGRKIITFLYIKSSMVLCGIHKLEYGTCFERI